MPQYVNLIDSNGNTQIQFNKPIALQTGTNADHALTKTQIDAAIAAALATQGTTNLPKRQTVFHGSVDAGGQANFLTTTATGIQLNATTTNVGFTFAFGINTSGPVDYRIVRTADETPVGWATLADGTHYLYVDYNSGTPSYGATVLQPSYKTIAPTTPTTGQFWFDTNNYKGYVWSGAAWVATARLFLGEAIFAGGSPSSVITYAINARYDSAWFGVAANTTYTKNHYIGIYLADGLKPEFYFSLDSAGADSSITHDLYVIASSGEPTGYYNRENVANSSTHQYIKFGFATNIATYRNSARTTGYFRIQMNRVW